MPRRGNIAKRDVLQDPVYNSKLVTRLINNIMLDGKKGVAQKIVYGAFDIVAEKTGKDAAEAVLKDSKNGTFTVILSDEKGNVLDTYTIDPETGKGKDSKGNDVDLPQTGNNSLKTAAAAAVAVTFMTVGAAAVYTSGVCRKKKDNE